MLYGQKPRPYNIWTMCTYFVWEKNMSKRHIEKLYMCCMDKTFSSIQHMDKFSICCMEKLSIYVI